MALRAWLLGLMMGALCAPVAYGEELTVRFDNPTIDVQHLTRDEASAKRELDNPQTVAIAEAMGKLPPDTAFLVSLDAPGMSIAYHVGLLTRRQVVNDVAPPRVQSVVWHVPSGVVGIWQPEPASFEVGKMDVQRFYLSGLLSNQLPLFVDNRYESPWLPLPARAVGGHAVGKQLVMRPFYISTLGDIYAADTQMQVVVPTGGDVRRRGVHNLKLADIDTPDDPLNYVFLLSMDGTADVALSVPLARVLGSAPEEGHHVFNGQDIYIRSRSFPRGRIDMLAPAEVQVRQMMVKSSLLRTAFPQAGQVFPK
ncbi:MAG: DUF3179 domain-containing protein [Proteobacteria bacterium]|nr:DUF3179 domain-containing protein [Pseudomonadota bacterium]